jgi:DNA repair photolyase
MDYCTYRAKSALYIHNRKNLPYSVDLNPYRGCSHRCIYCYAGAKALIRTGINNNKVDYKENIIELLEKELSTGRFQSEIINIGGSTDSYQSCEIKTAVMREILKLMIKYRIPVIISTKSDLIMRDIDLIKELSSKTYVNIAFSFSSPDQNYAEIFEPGAPPPEKRIKTLKTFSKEGINTGLHFFPVIPFVSDSEKSIEKMTHYAQESKCSYMMTGFLYLTGGIKNQFFNALENKNPVLCEKIKSVYINGRAAPEVKNRFHTILNKYIEKYGIGTNYRKFVPGELLKKNTVSPRLSEDKSQLKLDF